MRARSLLWACVGAALLACSAFDASDEGSPSTTSPDAGADGAIADAAPTLRPLRCALFCDDFERGDVAGGKWSLRDVTGLLTISSDAQRSPQRSLKATMPAGNNEPAYLVRNLAPDAKKLALSFSVRFESLPTSDFNLVSLDFSGAEVDNITLRFEKDGGFVLSELLRPEASSEQYKRVDIPAPSPGVFTRYTLAFDFPGGTTSVQVDDEPASISKPLEVAHGPFEGVRLGPNFLGPPSAPITFYIDDVEVTTPP